ncbi:hypothetical protein BST95_06005 [Halioglobus japonicus]|uniref:Uncharacterized protein n=1 Tax=Halioglobus japonicus TaxID=930805 RepID=A0AAP8SMV7_9GAMM|nr:hypothetical protein [Halioglobus japonicus]AQA17855.1 hypothetical protein BST95_06005 [Halioglobus japonicus]PLW85816.1 hypothetical protein C0029_14560 [Halioglobus japonicus]GHD17653.1 hypothetical protein GCM10007052_24370 [Halioglobus japonicus]
MAAGWAHHGGYRVSKGGDLIAMFKAQDERRDLLDMIYTRKAIDEYGIAAGSSYREIKTARPSVSFDTGYHYKMVAQLSSARPALR